MIRHTERRTYLRQIYKTPISVQESNNIFFYRARMVNFSYKGIYIETDIAFDESSDLIVGIEDSKFSSLTASPDGPKFFRVIIRWQKKLNDRFFNFGYGSKIILVADDDKALHTNFPFEQEFRKHSRKPMTQRAK